MTQAKPRDFLFPAIILAGFWSYGLLMFSQTHKTFFLFDLPYIGTAIALGSILGSILPRRRQNLGRLVTQFLIGVYMVFGLGVFMNVNMQIEQFWFMVFTLSFGGAIVHYLPAKLIGPALFGRGWCGWGCWTVSLLDLLPYKSNPNGRHRYWGALRYLHLGLAALSIGLIVVLSGYRPEGKAILVWFLASNGAYWISALVLTLILKDNRAFCKYLCPIPPLQKILGRFAVFKVQVNAAACVRCGICDRNCPMDIDLSAYMDHEKGRINSTECILCSRCTQVCPKQAIAIKPGLSLCRTERLRFAPSNQPPRPRLVGGE